MPSRGIGDDVQNDLEDLKVLMDRGGTAQDEDCSAETVENNVISIRWLRRSHKPDIESDAQGRQLLGKFLVAT